jgi:hypothetical protein
MKQETQDKFVEECKKVHNGRYDYSITVYNGSKNDIEYICPKHGVIRQNAHSHKSGHGCKYCATEENHNKSRYTLEDFIKKMRKVHGDKYDFSQAKYVDSKEEITLICHEKDALGNEHGPFSRKPYSLLQGHGCPKCNGRNKTTELWVAEAKKVFPEGLYSYEHTVYKSARDKVTITCNKHGDFDIPARDFLSGHGCPRCQMPSLELVLEKELQCAGINYEWQKKFDWLSGMSLDFYIDDIHIAIECQGVQHFENKDFFDKRETLMERKERDMRKRRLCKENGIELIYFLEGRFLKYANGENKYFTDIKDLLDYIVSKEDNFDE